MSVRLEFDGVGRAFPTAEALRDVTATLEPGSLTAVVGPSGAGKSTLLAIAAGLDTRYTGRLERRPAGGRTAMVFQEPRLMPWLSVERNVAFGLELNGSRLRDARRAAGHALSMVGLPHVARAWPWALSGGMRQRVSLARALVVDPDLLLLDEPLSALDEGNAAWLRDVLLRSCPPGRRTVLCVTHSLLDACLLADRVLVLAEGRLVRDLAVDLPRPRSPDDADLERLRAELSSVLRGLVPRADQPRSTP